MAPARRKQRKPSHRNEDPTQLKINKFIKKKKKVREKRKDSNRTRMVYTKRLNLRGGVGGRAGRGRGGNSGSGRRQAWVIPAWISYRLQGQSL